MSLSILSPGLLTLPYPGIAPAGEAHIHPLPVARVGWQVPPAHTGRPGQSTASTKPRGSLAVVPRQLAWPASKGEHSAHSEAVNKVRSAFIFLN